MGQIWTVTALVYQKKKKKKESSTCYKETTQKYFSSCDFWSLQEKVIEFEVKRRLYGAFCQNWLNWTWTVFKGQILSQKFEFTLFSTLVWGLNALWLSRLCLLAKIKFSLCSYEFNNWYAPYPGTIYMNWFLELGDGKGSCSVHCTNGPGTAVTQGAALSMIFIFYLSIYLFIKCALRTS